MFGQTSNNYTDCFHSSSVHINKAVYFGVQNLYLHSGTSISTLFHFVIPVSFGALRFVFFEKISSISANDFPSVSGKYRYKYRQPIIPIRPLTTNIIGVPKNLSIVK